MYQICQPLGDEILMSTGTSCHFGHLLQVSKKSLWSLILYNFFHDFILVYSPVAGADSPQEDKILMSTERPYHFTHLLQVSKKSDFIQFFHDLIHVYSPGAGEESPQGQSFYVNRNVLSFHSFVESCWSPILNNFFHDLIHVYSPGTWADSPKGTKFWCQQKGLITLPICYKFQRNLFEVWFYTWFLSGFNTCI